MPARSSRSSAPRGDPPTGHVSDTSWTCPGHVRPWRGGPPRPKAARAARGRTRPRRPAPAAPAPAPAPAPPAGSPLAGSPVSRRGGRGRLSLSPLRASPLAPPSPRRQRAGAPAREATGGRTGGPCCRRTRTGRRSRLRTLRESFRWPGRGTRRSRARRTPRRRPCRRRSTRRRRRPRLRRPRAAPIRAKEEVSRKCLGVSRKRHLSASN